MAGVGFITGTVGGHAEVLVWQIGMKKGVNKELVNALVSVLRVNAQIVDASGGARKEHGTDEQIFVTQDEGSVFEDAGA